MKRILLIAALSLFSFVGSAQVIFYVEAPSPNEGSYEFTYAEPGAWGVPDMIDPLNAITDTMAFVDPSDTLACGAIATDLTGKIAVLYRGTCQFGTKALNAQNAGAVGVIIINNVGGSPIAMGGGTDGPTVTIPVVMISDVTGALLMSEVLSDTTTVFIGNKTGKFTNDLGLFPQHVLRPKHFGNIQALSQDASEFNVELGAWVYNYGTAAQTNVTLNATVDLGVSNLYDNSSTPIASLASGDSVWIPLPTFDQTSYANGYYDIEYSLSGDAADEFIGDNNTEADFIMNDTIFANGLMNSSTLFPVASGYYRGGSTVSSNQNCIAFKDANASRIGVRGMRGALTSNDSLITLDGALLEVYIYQWDDAFTDINDATLDALSVVASGEHIYLSNDEGVMTYVEVEDPVVLADDQWYLFCVSHLGENYFVGYDGKIDYMTNIDTHLEPMHPNNGDGTWYLGGYSSIDYSPAISAKFFMAEEVSLIELPEGDIEAYPNPAQTIVNVMLAGYNGDVEMTVIDLSGKVVASQSNKVQGGMTTLDVSTITEGTYIVKAKFDTGDDATFRIVVTH